MASEQLQSCLRDNSSCFDCTEPQANYLSSDFGVTLCEACAQLHQNSGYSTVIDLLESSAEESHCVLLLRNGGNEQFRQFLEGFKVKLSTPQEFKYRIKAAWVYRECLLEAVYTGKPVRLPLVPIEEGLQWQPDRPQSPKPQTPIVQAATELYDVAAVQGEQIYGELNEFTKVEGLRKVESKALGLLDRVDTWLSSKRSKPA